MKQRFLIRKLVGGGLVQGTEHTVEIDGAPGTIKATDSVLLQGDDAGFQRNIGYISGINQPARQVLGYLNTFTGLGMFKPLDDNTDHIDSDLLAEARDLPGKIPSSFAGQVTQALA